MNNDVQDITLPTVSPFTPGKRLFSNMDSPNTVVGRDLVSLFDETKVVEEQLSNKHIDVVSINKKKKRRALDIAGKIVSLCFSVGCGVTAAAALATLISGPAFFVLAGVLCLSTTYANFRMTNNDVSNIFIGGLKGLFQKKVVVNTTGEAESVDRTSPYLSRKRMLMLAGGAVLSLSFGMVFGALTYGSTIGLVSAFGFLGAVSVALPPIGIVLGVMTFICLSCLMVKAFSDLVKTENLKEKIKTKLLDLFVNRDPVRDAGKSRRRFIAERVLTAVAAATLVGGVFGLVIWGQISTLANCAREFGKIIATFGNASQAAVSIVSNIIGIGFALAAQIPFIIKTSVQPIFKLFARSSDKEATPFKSTAGEKVKSVLLIVSAALSATATATIALAGKSLGLLPILAGVGAFLNNFLGSVVNATLSQPLPAAPAVPVTPANENTGDSTSAINKQLEYNSHFTFQRSPAQHELDATVDTADQARPSPSVTIVEPVTPTAAVNDASPTQSMRRISLSG